MKSLPLGSICLKVLLYKEALLALTGNNEQALTDKMLCVALRYEILLVR